MDMYNKAIDISKFVLAPEEVKLDIFTKYSLIADVIYGGAGVELIKNNKETFRPLMAPNILKWAMSEKGRKEYNKVAESNNKLNKLFENEGSLIEHIKVLAKNCNIQIPKNSTYKEVEIGLSLFGIEDIDYIETEEDLDEIPIEDLDEDIEIDDIEIQFDDDYIDEFGIDNLEGIDEYIGEDDIGEGLEGSVENEVDGDKEASNSIKDKVSDEYIEDDGYTEDNNDVEYSDNIENEGNIEDKPRYIEKIHGMYKNNIIELVMSTWADLYSYHVDGKEVIDGFIIPGGSILGTGEDIRYEGILTLNTSKIEVEPNTMSNAIYEEFIGACEDCGIPIVKTVADDAKDIKPFKYNPLVQRLIASGLVDKETYKLGWNKYSESLKRYIENKAKELAVIRAETGSDVEIYKELSAYTIALVVVNYRSELGTQLRICCGDTSKTKQVADRLVARLKAREKTHRSIAQGKLIVGNASLSDTGLTATIGIYQNLAGYQAVPQFLGELLYNMREGMFKPSINNMIIGVDLSNKIVKAPFQKWMLPIIAGSRSGKGVLTLNMLINVIGCGAPLFYLDGKPDMATLLWKLQKKYNIDRAIVIDGLSYEGVSDIDRKEFRAPYADILENKMRESNADSILVRNFGTIIYLKTMMVILLACRYYKDKMGCRYGNLFVVFDEMFAVMKLKIGTLISNIENELDKTKRGDDRRDELNKIRAWVKELLDDYIGNDIGVFGGGIKAVGLTQFALDGQYSVNKFETAKTFCTNFLLRRSPKLFGRQEGGSGKYGVLREKGDDLVYELYDKYYHFGIGVAEGNTYNNLKTFKPLLVLNENDCKELTGNNEDGAFIGELLNRVSRYTDIDKFRRKYFTNKDLAEALGFEGCLKQMGRILGEDYRVLLKNSLERAYDISDEALRYYGIIGLNGINSVYDYICSFDIDHLWTFNEIVTSKKKGIPLSGGYGDENERGTIFGEVQDIDDGIEDSGNSVIDFGIANESLEGEFEELSKEEADILEDIKSRDSLAGNGILKDNGINTSDILYSNAEDINDTVDNIDIKPDEDNVSYTEPVYNYRGKNIRVNDVGDIVKRVSRENAILATLENSHPLEKYERKLFRTLRGSNYEFNRRWDAMLNSISQRINPDLITRVVLIQDEMYVNGRLVMNENITGGFANIRLEDIVNFKKLFKRFRNIMELTLDSEMVERFRIEQPNLPQGFFAYSKKLNKVSIILDNGRKEVFLRHKIMSSESLKDIETNSKLEVVCAAKNTRLSEKNPGYQSKIWSATKSFGSKGWESVRHQITKNNPSFMKALGVGLITTGVVVIGSTVYGIGRLFNMFRGN